MIFFLTAAGSSESMILLLAEAADLLIFSRGFGGRGCGRRL